MKNLFIGKANPHTLCKSLPFGTNGVLCGLLGCVFPHSAMPQLEFIVYLQTVEVAWSFKTKRKKGTKRIVEDELVLSSAVYGTLRAKTGKAMKLG